ncbi:MAG TPA: hypothetical protein VGD48_32775, partial [Kutzneria sp.]
MTAIIGETPLWHLEKEELYDVLRRGERERRRIYLESLEVIEELLGRNGRGQGRCGGAVCGH